MTMFHNETTVDEEGNKPRYHLSLFQFLYILKWRREKEKRVREKCLLIIYNRDYPDYAKNSYNSVMSKVSSF